MQANKIDNNLFYGSQSFLGKGISFSFMFLIFVLSCFNIEAQHGKPLGYVRDESKHGIDIYTGRTNFSVPIVQIKGRGETGASLGVPITQPQWQVTETSRYYHPTTGQLMSINYAPVPLYLTTSNIDNGYLNPGFIKIVTRGKFGGWGFSDAISNVIEFTSSDGTKYELRDTTRDGEFSVLGAIVNPPSNENCFVQTYDNQTPFPQPLPPEQVQPPTNSSCLRGRIFRSADGSGMTFVADEDIYDATYTNHELSGMGWQTVYSGGFYGKAKGTLYLPNGTKYRFVSEIAPTYNTQGSYSSPQGSLVLSVDRNGNQTSFLYGTNPATGCDPLNGVSAACYKLVKVTDSINREIVFSYGESTQESYYDTVTYKGFGGGEKQVRINYNKMQYALRPDQSLKTPYQLFPTIGNVNVNNSTQALLNELDKYEKNGSSNAVNESYNPTVVTNIVLPNNQQYTFKYNSYGELARIVSPLNSYTDYEYGAINDNNADAYGVVFTYNYDAGANVPNLIYRRGTESKNFDETAILQGKTTVSGAGGINPAIVKNFDKDGSTVLSASKHYFYTTGAQPLVPTWYSSLIITHTSWRENREYKTEILDPANLNNVLRKTEMAWEQRTSVTWCGNDWHDGYEPQNDPRVTEVKTTLETNQVTKKTFSYDQYNNIIDTFEYDFGNGQSWQFLRRSHTDYVTDSNYTGYTGSHLRRLPLQGWVSSDSAGNNKASLMLCEYDNYNINPIVSRSSVSGHDTVNYGTSNLRRGNVTKVTNYSDAQNQSGAISNQTQYDILGNVVKTFDGKGYITTIDYTDRFGTPNGVVQETTAPPSQLNGLYAFAYASSTTNQRGYTVFSQFDYYSGLVVDSEDVNGNVNTTFYNDVFDRPTQFIKANNHSSLRSQTTYNYNDVGRIVTVTSDLYSFGDNLAKVESLYDSLGRTTEKRTYETGGYVVVKQLYESLAKQKISNPFRPYLSEAEVYTTTEFDTLGRIKKTITPDTQESTIAYSGNITTTTDQANKKSRTITNALGQLTRIDEPDINNNLGDSTSPTQPTYYTYNVLGNLAKISQGQQTRYFLYDSLGRLIRVRQPEQSTNSSLTLYDPITNNSLWSAGSTYDNNSNPLTTTDAKGTVVTQTFDNLNRPLTRSYSDATPAVAFEYDNQSVSFSKGQLTKTSSIISETRYTQFDTLGRIKASEQLTTPEQRNGTQPPYSMSYTYNLSGALIEETYPSGRVIKNNLDNDGKLKDVSSKSAGQSDFHLAASNLVYAANGVVTSLRLGNGRWQSMQLNSRLQITQIGLGNSQGATNLWQINNNYGEIDANGNLDQSKNNGNVARQTMNFSGLSQSFVQTYQYDFLNRLNNAKEMNGTAQTWNQSFGYDRYGNRTSINQQKIGEQAIMQTPAIDPDKNRFITGTGFLYDSNGNVTTDNQNRQFTFNGDNKQIEVRDAANNIIGLYYYDGMGRRIKKVSSSETTIFVYNAMGKLVAEYANQIPANPTISYLTTDTLGSPRVITDNGGNVLSRRDFMPFGEELYAGTANRTSSTKYAAGSDNVRKRFTGYEKDSETNLDYAAARMYNNQHGRFTSVDPLLASGLSANPQTFNRYVYVANNPVVLTDSSGMFIEAWTCGGSLWGFSGQSYDSPFPTVSEFELSHSSRSGPREPDQNGIMAPGDVTTTVNIGKDFRAKTVGLGPGTGTLPAQLQKDLQNVAEQAEQLEYAQTVNANKAVDSLRSEYNYANQNINPTTDSLGIKYTPSFVASDGTIVPTGVPDITVSGSLGGVSSGGARMEIKFTATTLGIVEAANSQNKQLQLMNSTPAAENFAAKYIKQYGDRKGRIYIRFKTDKGKVLTAASKGVDMDKAAIMTLYKNAVTSGQNAARERLNGQ